MNATTGSNSFPTLPTASAHGRFQPFHLGHLEYLLAAKARCDFLWIGITQYLAPALQTTTPEDVHRSLPENNPLTYFERAEIIQRALTDVGVNGQEYDFTPFPIEEPGLLRNFLDPSILVFTTVYDDWNRHKIQVLREKGYTVEVLWERTNKDYAGDAIRRAIVDDDSRWRSMVPNVVAARLDELNFAERLRRLASPR
jgi:cytidyltransferase-like protein